MLILKSVWQNRAVLPRYQTLGFPLTSFRINRSGMGDNAIKTALKVTSTATLSKSALYYGIFWPAKRGDCLLCLLSILTPQRWSWWIILARGRLWLALQIYRLFLQATAGFCIGGRKLQHSSLYEAVW